jgi:hypothetical protein
MVPASAGDADRAYNYSFTFTHNTYFLQVKPIRCSSGFLVLPLEEANGNWNEVGDPRGSNGFMANLVARDTGLRQLQPILFKS